MRPRDWTYFRLYFDFVELSLTGADYRGGGELGVTHGLAPELVALSCVIIRLLENSDTVSKKGLQIFLNPDPTWS